MAIEPKNQRISVAAFIFYDEEVLVVRRAPHQDYKPGFYELPGGKVELGEDPGAAIKREVIEETNLEVKVLKPYWLFSHVKDEFHVIDIQYICVIMDEDPKVKLSREHDDYKWISEDQLDTIQISQEMKMAISQGFKSLYS